MPALPPPPPSSPAHVHTLSAAQDLNEFKLLGKAMTGKEPTIEETATQLRRADLNGDGQVSLCARRRAWAVHRQRVRLAQLSLEEWLTFSSRMAKLSAADFTRTVNGYIKRVEELRASA